MWTYPGFNTFGRGRIEALTAHPTVKPLALMRYLVKLITPPGGIVLDHFAGSGTTLVAARSVGVSSIGIERHPFIARVARCKLTRGITAAEILLAGKTIAARAKIERARFSQPTQALG